MRYVRDHHARELAIQLVDAVKNCLRPEEVRDAVHEFTRILQIGLEDYVRAEAAEGRRLLAFQKPQ